MAAAASASGAKLAQATMNPQGPSLRPSETAPSATLADTAQVPAANPVKFNDAEILGWVLVLDSNEIAAADAVEKKKLDKDVMGYAKMLRKQHKDDLSETEKAAKKAGVVPVSNGMTNQMRSQGPQDLTSLTALNGEDFRKAYIDAMVKGHSDALETIDAKLMPNAVSDIIKKRVADLRGHISKHLEQGKRLQENRAAAAE